MLLQTAPQTQPVSPKPPSAPKMEKSIREDIAMVEKYHALPQLQHMKDDPQFKKSTDKWWVSHLQLADLLGESKRLHDRLGAPDKWTDKDRAAIRDLRHREDNASANVTKYGEQRREKLVDLADKAQVPEPDKEAFIAAAKHIYDMNAIDYPKTVMAERDTAKEKKITDGYLNTLDAAKTYAAQKKTELVHAFDQAAGAMAMGDFTLAETRLKAAVEGQKIDDSDKDGKDLKLKLLTDLAAVQGYAKPASSSVPYIPKVTEPGKSK